MGRWDRIGFACVILNKIVLSVVKMIFSSFSRISTIFHRKTPTIVKDTEECASHMTPDAVKHAKRGNVTAESLKIEFTGTSIKNRSFQNIFMELQLRFVLYFLSLLHEKRNLVSKNFGLITTRCSGTEPELLPQETIEDWTRENAKNRAWQ